MDTFLVCGVYRLEDANESDSLMKHNGTRKLAVSLVLLVSACQNVTGLNAFDVKGARTWAHGPVVCLNSQRFSDDPDSCRMAVTWQFNEQSRRYDYYCIARVGRELLSLDVVVDTQVGDTRRLICLDNRYRIDAVLYERSCVVSAEHAFSTRVQFTHGNAVEVFDGYGWILE